MWNLNIMIWQASKIDYYIFQLFEGRAKNDEDEGKYENNDFI